MDNIKKIFIAFTIIFTVAVAFVSSNLYFNFWPELNSFFAESESDGAEPPKEQQSQLAETQIQPQSPPATKPEVIDGAVLQERYESAQQYEPTPDEIAEEQAFETEQIAEAEQWLKDLDAEQRIAGIEQLAAYPSPKAEQLMVERLKNDKSDEIRIAAADNLSYIEVPTVATQDALVQALQDKNEELRTSALNTLESFVASLEDEDETAKRIVGLLKKQLKSQQVPSDIKEAIKEYLSDQFEN